MPIGPHPFCDAHKMIPVNAGIPVNDVLRGEDLRAAVQKRAYFLWKEDGRPHGRSDYFWGLAKTEFELWNGWVKDLER